MHRREVDLQQGAESVPPARRFVTEALAAWDLEALSWSAALVVTELAANAALHAGTGFTVVVALEGDTVRVEVHDGSARLPRTRSHSAESTTGRGLRLVEGLASAWGVDRSPTGGKAVWALLPATVEADGDPDEEADVDALLSAFADELGDVGEPDAAGPGRAVVGLAA